jgi:hypothetical protein
VKGEKGPRVVKFKAAPALKPVPEIVKALEQALTMAKQGRMISLGIVFVMDGGGFSQVCVHNVLTISSLVCANRLLEATLVQQLLTTYKGGIPEKWQAPENPPPKGDTTGVPEADEDD